MSETETNGVLPEEACFDLGGSDPVRGKYFNAQIVVPAAVVRAAVERRKQERLGRSIDRVLDVMLGDLPVKRV